MSIEFKLIATCLWCEKEIPFDQNINGKLLCSRRCLKEINAHINKPEFRYTREEVVKWK